jgi:hypothetical protein
MYKVFCCWRLCHQVKQQFCFSCDIQRYVWIIIVDDDSDAMDAMDKQDTNKLPELADDWSLKVSDDGAL